MFYLNKYKRVSGEICFANIPFILSGPVEFTCMIFLTSRPVKETIDQENLQFTLNGNRIGNRHLIVISSIFIAWHGRSLHSHIGNMEFKIKTYAV